MRSKMQQQMLCKVRKIITSTNAQNIDIYHVSGMRFIQAGQHTQLALSLTIKFLSSGFKLSFKAAAIALSLVRKKVIQ